MCYESVVELHKPWSSGVEGGLEATLVDATEAGGVESMTHDNSDFKLDVARRGDSRWGLYALLIWHTVFNVPWSTCIVVVHRSGSECNE